MEFLPLPKQPKSCVFRLVPNSQLHVNKANNATEVFDNEVAYWELDVEFTNVQEQAALELDDFLAKLRGSVGAFLLHDARFEQANLDTVVYVSGSNQDGNTLAMTNLPSGQVYTRAGSNIQVGSSGCVS